MNNLYADTVTPYYFEGLNTKTKNRARYVWEGLQANQWNGFSMFIVNCDV